MSQTSVSVIIIFLNGDEFIREAIESVFSQTYDNWELLLVDDGSTDASPEIALWYVERCAGKVRYLAHKGHQNRGMSASRNLGISHARGEYIAFLDADDVWLPHKLAQQVAILESHPEAAMIYGPCLLWFSWAEGPENIQPDVIQSLNVQSNTMVKPPTLLLLFLQNDRFVPSPSGIMVRHEAIVRFGGFEEAFRGMYEDQVFCAKVCLAAPVFVASECWYRYRMHPKSHSQVALNEGRYHSSRHVFLVWLEDYLLEHDLKGGEVWQALQKHLFPYRNPMLHRLSDYARHPVESLRSLLKLLLRRILPTFACIHLRALWQRYRYH